MDSTLETTINIPTVEPETATPDTGTGSGFRVILYNDDFHSMEEVVMQLQKATGCSEDKAVFHMLEAHYNGRTVCYQGDRARCHEVVRVLREIRLQAEVDCD